MRDSWRTTIIPVPPRDSGDSPMHAGIFCPDRSVRCTPKKSNYLSSYDLDLVHLDLNMYFQNERFVYGYSYSIVFIAKLYASDYRQITQVGATENNVNSRSVLRALWMQIAIATR
jgi:hypothetical protein